MKLSCNNLKRVLLSTADTGPDDLWFFQGSDGELVATVTCNDLFFWGVADCEKITDENVDVYLQSKIDDDICGEWLFCCRVRSLRPQGAAYTYIDKKLWPLYDACGPERETGFGNPCKPGEYKDHEIR